MMINMKYKHTHTHKTYDNTLNVKKSKGKSSQHEASQSITRFKAYTNSRAYNTSLIYVHRY